MEMNGNVADQLIKTIVEFYIKIQLCFQLVPETNLSHK